MEELIGYLFGGIFILVLALCILCGASIGIIYGIEWVSINIYELNNEPIIWGVIFLVIFLITYYCTIERPKNKSHYSENMADLIIIFTCLMILAAPFFIKNLVPDKYINRYFVCKNNEKEQILKEGYKAVCRATGSLNIRSGPSTSRRIIEIISSGDEVTILGATIGDGGMKFMKVRTNDGLVGWSWSGRNDEFFEKIKDKQWSYF